MKPAPDTNWNETHIESHELPPREVIEYFEIPLRRPMLFLVPLVLTFAVAMAVYLVTPRKYTSATLIVIEADKVPDAFLQRQVVEKTGQRLRLLKQELLSRTRLERILKELDPYPQLTGRRTSTEVVDMMRNLIDVKVKADDSFTIEYTHTNPYLAMAVTNRLATLFIEESSQAREQVTSSALQFIDTQLDGARRELQEKEASLGVIKMKYLGSLPQELTTNLGVLQRLQLEKQTLGDSLRGAEDRRLNLESALVQQQREDEKRAFDPDPAHASPASIAKMREELDSLRARYTEEHPDVRRIAGQLDRLVERQAQQEQREQGEGHSSTLPFVSADTSSLRAQLEQLKLDIASLQRKRDEAEARAVVYEERITQTPKVEQELLSLNRDYEKLKEHYASMLNKKMDTELADKLEKQYKDEQFRMIDPAYLPGRPSSPNFRQFLLVGLGLGIAFGAGAAIAAEQLDHSVKNPRELEVVLPYPLLATVPHISSARFGLGRRAPFIRVTQ